jgi:hypothetical protein
MRDQSIKTDQQPAETNQTVSRAEWLRRFAECLLLLHPGTIATAVAKHVATSPQDSELEPEEAAMKFIFEQPLDDIAITH